jgi:hypothetical protein
VGSEEELPQTAMAQPSSACLPAATARASFASLPHALVLAVFAQLPMDARARCKLVCRGWRDTVDDVSLWTRLDVTCTVNDAALRGSSGLARGRLAALDVSGRAGVVSHDTLLAVTTANALALIELRACHGDERELSLVEAETLLSAAPLLRVLGANVRVADDDAVRMLRNEALFGPLRVRHLGVDWRDEDHDVGTVADLLAAIAEHPSLCSVDFTDAPLDVPGALDAVVDSALARRLSSVTLALCRLSPASAPALVRLLSGSAMTELDITEDGMTRVLDMRAAALLGDALRANSTLTKLTLYDINLFADAPASAALLGALMGHASLQSIMLAREAESTEEAVALIGRAIGALVATNTPALKKLYVGSCHLGDTGMHPLLWALPHNTHLKVLSCADVHMSAAFTRHAAASCACQHIARVAVA